MSNGPSDNEEDMSTMLRNLAATAFLALFSWHLITLHNIAKSVEVLIEKVSAGNTRIERLENEVFFKEYPNGTSQSRNP
jgi:Tfp pilus assembly protein PilN